MLIFLIPCLRERNSVCMRAIERERKETFSSLAGRLYGETIYFHQSEFLGDKEIERDSDCV